MPALVCTRIQQQIWKGKWVIKEKWPARKVLWTYWWLYCWWQQYFYWLWYYDPRYPPDKNSSIQFKHLLINRRHLSAWKIYVRLIHDLFYTRNKNRSTKTSNYDTTEKNGKHRLKGYPDISRDCSCAIYRLQLFSFIRVPGIVKITARYLRLFF